MGAYLAVGACPGHYGTCTCTQILHKIFHPSAQDEKVLDFANYRTRSNYSNILIAQMASINILFPS